MYRLTDYGSMLRDRRRVDAYRRALAACITPTSVVLDLGTGLGTFGMLAAQLGAARVYAVDSADVIATAEELARANGVAERMRFLRARASEIDLPEKVDVIVSDLSGALPLFEEHIPTLIHAREHFLKPDGVLIPRGARLFCAPVSSEALYARIIEPWRGIDGVDFSIAERKALQTPHALPVEPRHLVAERRVWAELDYAAISSPNVSGTASWSMSASHVIHGIALWFESVLHSEVVSSSGPEFPDSVHATMVLPLLVPFATDTLRCSIDATLVDGRYAVQWNVAGRDDATFAVSDRVVSRRVGNEVLLLDLSTGVYQALNETAARMWSLLQDGASIESIAATVAAEFDIDPQTAETDARALLAQLLAARLIARR
jgi:SAM-dependent methyltransferase